MDKAINNIQDFIQDETSKLDKGIVATPQDREYLESFANANHGSNDFLLMQMAMQFGYKMALENVGEHLAAMRQEEFLRPGMYIDDDEWEDEMGR